MGDILALRKGSPAESSKKKVASVDALLELATVDFSEARNANERLELMRDILINSIPVAEGYFRKYTSQSASYALSNLINQLQGIETQIEEKTDWDEIGKELTNTILQPAIEGIVLELGKLIRDEVRNLSTMTPQAKKHIKESFDSIYRSFGKVVGDKTEEMKEEVIEFMIN